MKDPGRLDFEHGLGIPLVQFLADEVEYSTDAHGTEGGRWCGTATAAGR